MLPAQLQQSMSTLQQLRHLQLECSDVQLADLAGLSHLTALILSSCHEMTELPAGISTLTTLACLDCSRYVCTQYISRLS